MDDTANFTAATALDESTPVSLKIASFQLSPHILADVATKVTTSSYALANLGIIQQLDAYNKSERSAHPEQELELFPRWQMGQYIHNMFSSHHLSLDNKRYPDLSWTNAHQFISNLLTANHKVTSG